MFTLAHIHPMVVHFPIVLALCLVVIDAIALRRGITLDGSGTFASFSFATALATGVTALVALTFGEVAMGVATSNGVPETLLETHEGLGTAAALLFAGWAILRWLARWRAVSLDGPRTRWVVLIEAALVLVVLVTAFFGGQLVYANGVNVAVGG